MFTIVLFRVIKGGLMTLPTIHEKTNQLDGTPKVNERKWIPQISPIKGAQ